VSRTARNSALGALAALALALGMGASALAVQGTAGVYHGVLNGSVSSPCGNEGEGFFRLKNKKVVPVGNASFCGSPITVPKILAPSNFQCNQLNANLDTSSIKVSGGGFDYKGKAPIGPGGANRTVRFKGSWANKTKVTGYTKISGGGCDSGHLPWKMKLAP
jgi:hypothetical protein